MKLDGFMHVQHLCNVAIELGVTQPDLQKERLPGLYLCATASTLVQIVRSSELFRQHCSVLPWQERLILGYSMPIAHSPATIASQAPAPVFRRAALSSRVTSLLSWNTTLARISASANTCMPNSAFGPS